MQLKLKTAIFTCFIWLAIIFPLNHVTAQTDYKAGFTLAPNKETVSSGDTLQITINMNTGGEKVNSFIAQLSYPQDKLSFESITTDTSPFTMALEATGENGVVKIIRGSTTSQTGDLFIAKVNFKAKSEAAASEITLSKESAIISSDNKNILPESNIVDDSSQDSMKLSEAADSSQQTKSNPFVSFLNSIFSFFSSLFK